MAPQLILFSKQTIIQASPISILVFTIPQGEIITLWICGCTWIQMLCQACSDTSIFEDVVGARTLFPWWPCIGPCCTRQCAYQPSNDDNWRVWIFRVSKMLNSSSYSFKKQLILHKIFNLPTKTLQFESNKFKHSPLRHVHLILVHHT